MNTIIRRGFRRREVVLAWVPIGLATLPFTAAAIDPPSTTLANGARVAIVDDTLEIEGTPEDDLIQIGATRHPDTVRVTVDGEDRGHHGPIVRIEIHAGAGDDTVRVGERVELPVRINGGPGNDRLHGGSGHDLVFGEDGDDVLFASRGRDAFDGGAGSNQLRIGQPTERIWVGSATGEAARILSQAYRLVPLNTDAPATELGPIVVGIADLADEDIAEHLRTAYQAGHTIALTGAEAEHAETLRNLLGHASGAGWSEDIPQTDLVAFRRAIRPDGGAHESTSILLPRVEELLPAEARLGRREADMLVVEALSQLFSGTPVLADESICTGVSPEECLQTLAESYQSQILVQNNGAKVQITNSAYNARSFQNGFDLYYVFQEVAYTAVAGGLDVEWLTESTNRFGRPSLLGPPSLIEPSPETTLETTTVTSSIAQSYGGSTGYNQTQGLNATLSGGVTIQNSTSITIPPVVITFTETPDPFAEAKWSKSVSGFGSGARTTTVIFYNQWIWEVPFGLYAAGQTDTAFQTDVTFLDLISTAGVEATLDSAVPLPFGDTFALQPPVVTSVDPDDVCEGDKFTITGTGLYPTLVEAVLIDGTPLEPSAVSAASDTAITVVAPEIPGLDLPVVVQTTEGLSNDDVTIEIASSLDPFCDLGTSSAPAAVRPQSAAAGAEPAG